MTTFVPYFIIIIGVILLLMGAFFLLASQSSVEKYIKWLYSFSTAKPKKSFVGRPLKTLRINGLFVVIAGIFMVVFGIYINNQLQNILLN